MHASAYYPASLPYYFQTSNSLGSLSKLSDNDNTYGIGVVLKSGNTGFSYSMKSLTVDKNNIKFIELPQIKDTTAQRGRIQYLPLDSLNTYLLSEPFTIQKGTVLNFSEGRGFVPTTPSDSTAAKNLDKNFHIGCKIELIEDGTNKLLGTVKQTSFALEDKDASDLMASNYNINSNSTNTVRIKITITSDKKDVQGMLVNEFNTVNDKILSKLAVEQSTLELSGIPKSFALGQNYPNPFNPKTQISYQLPKAAKVTLKVYDVLGREVATLVNKNQDAGNYQVAFNGSNLATGIYIYTLQAGKYNESKKMILVK